MRDYRWTIGNVEIDGPLVLAPLAGYTAPPMRLLAKRAGAHLVYSEMVAAHGLWHRNRKSFGLLEVWPQEHPVALQIFGGEPEIMARAVPHVQHAGADVIDINMGCPVPKVLRAEGGASLLVDPDRAVAVAKAVIAEATIPVTCKIRAGLREGDTSYIDLARRLEAEGVAAIAIHGRTVKQAYHGEAHYAHVAALVEALSIPVVASGDVTSPYLPASILHDTGCAAVMVARGAIGRPWVFTQAQAVLDGREPPPDPPVAGRLAVALCHAQLMAEYRDEHTAVHEMRSHLAWYTRGIPGGRKLRSELNTAGSLQGMLEIIEQYARWRRGSEPVDE